MTRERLAALRALMSQYGMDAYIVTGGDDHASEYTAAHWRTREWLSGFSGSAGVLVVLHDEAGLWTDARYFTQAENELRDSGITLYKMNEPGVPTYQAFLATAASPLVSSADCRTEPHDITNSSECEKPRYTIGFDGRTLTASTFNNTLYGKVNAEFAYKHDLIGMLWHDRPPIPTEKAFCHPLQLAGLSASEKIEEVRRKMKEKSLSAYLVTALDSVAWLLNIRGSDIENLPVVYAFVLVTETDVHVFADYAKMPACVTDNFTLHEYDGLSDFLKNADTENLYFNPTTTNILLQDKMVAKQREPWYNADDIITQLKAVKTKAELANIKNAFVKEGAAMVKTLYWLERALAGGRAVTEGEISRVMQGFRREQPLYVCDSFPTIAAYGANAAQAHYSPRGEGTEISGNGLLLLDTGGQYLDGTTDTTRTICIGEISHEMKRDFTLVLKGHIALSRAVFPKGATGGNLDILARLPLWEAGKDFKHGTGHGVGYCLSVHEGPQTISPVNETALAEGMLITNEPAYYKEGSHGIRTENVLAVTVKGNTDSAVFYCFEVLTHCPIDTRAIDTEMLTVSEKEWLNEYHKRTYDVLSPYLSEGECGWLERVTGAV
ncbi:MAG: aminopeptidase P family protein [Defluviitaleaceae bacterium]|nr:aminopeptidase P family protein [Defluviitaleaceae bacterium]